MAVEILILSGARQGDRLELHQTSFLVAGRPNADVYFDPDRDPAVLDRAASFQRADDGWYLQNDGLGDVWINQEKVIKRTRIRSGDVVRMSERGPDFSFTIQSSVDTTSHAASTSTPELTPIETTTLENVSQNVPQEETLRSKPPSLPAAAALPAATASQPASNVSKPWADSPTADEAAGTSSRRWWIGGLSVLTLGMIALFGILFGLDILHFRTPTSNETSALQIETIPNQSVRAGETVDIHARVKGLSSSTEKVDFKLSGDVPDDARIDSHTGQFEWVPKTPGSYSIHVQAFTSSETRAETRFTVTVESALPRAVLRLKPIKAQSADVGTAISIPVTLTDPASWTGKATFRLIDGPFGATLDSTTGRFEWIPSRAGDYTVVVAVASNGSDPVEDTTQFSINVVMGPIDVVAESLYLLEIEDPKSEFVWPLATACAIGPKTLLCTASAATDLARHRKMGRQLKAMHPGSEFKTAINKLRIHMAFVRLKDEPEKQIYFDVALLAVEGSLPHQTAPLATMVQASKLERGMTLTALGIPHDGKSVTRFQAYSPQLIEATLFAITALDPDRPGGPRLLHLRGEIPPSIPGCPLITAEGHVVAIYSVSSPVEKPQDLAIHYAPIVPMDMIAAWLRGEDQDMWVEPDVPDNPFPDPSDDKSDR